jgi:hypothetical protein
MSDAAAVPTQLQPYVDYVTFATGDGSHDGVELMLTKKGIEYARANGNRGSMELARWLTAATHWQGHRSQKNVADEISTHALYANWPLLGKRANPVNIEYFQNWPVSLVLRVRDRALRLAGRTLHTARR